MKRHKKNRILTYFLSFLPGVGFMYRGYMKRGFSYLVLFLIVSSVLNWLAFPVLTVIPVLIWFYAFFDQINTLSAAEEEPQIAEDKVILDTYVKRLDKNFITNNHKLIGAAFLILGSYLMMKYVYTSLVYFLPVSMQPALLSLMNYTPQLLLSCIILYCGTRFLQGNTKLITIFRKSVENLSLNKQQQNQLAQANVVYYMEKGEMPVKTELESKPEEGRSFSQVLDEVSREQLLQRAKHLLEDDIYKSIHIETAATMERPVLEKAPVIESAPVIERANIMEEAAKIDKVEVEKCPDLF